MQDYRKELSYQGEVEVRLTPLIINPRRACAARVTVLGSVCVCVSPMERLFVLKMLSRTQRATKVKKFVGICLKRLRSRVMPRNMSEKANTQSLRQFQILLHDDVIRSRGLLARRCDEAGFFLQLFRPYSHKIPEESHTR